MASFADVVDLESFLGATFTVDEASRVVGLLEDATELIQDRTQQHLFYVEDDTVTLYATRRTVGLFLPELPVVEVDSVTVGGVLLAATDYDLDPEVGGLARLSSSWTSGLPRVPVEVIYSHGLDPIPGWCRRACENLAGDTFLRPKDNLESVSSDGYSARFRDWSADWRTEAYDLIDSHRIVSVA